MSFTRVRLGDVCSLNYGKSLRGYSPEPDESLPVRVFGTNGPIGWSSLPLCENETIVVGRKGAYRGIHYSPGASWTIDTAYFLTLNSSDTDLKWLYYRLLLVDINRMDTGSAIPSTKREDFYSAHISMPPLDGQRRIAVILSAYDELIDNNRRRIQLLEQAARLLYKEWFVHLRFPGHEHIPVVDGVPEGWTSGVVSDFYTTSSGGTPSRKVPEFYDGDIPWVKTKELNGGFILTTEEQISTQALRRSAARLFSRHTVLVAMYGATIGQSAILSIPSATNQACCAILPKEPGTSPFHARYFFQHHRADLVSLGQGAAQKNISQERIRGFKMILPLRGILDLFSETVSPLLAQMENLEKTNANLSKGRDLFLPRLMNGEIPV